MKCNERVNCYAHKSLKFKSIQELVKGLNGYKLIYF